MSASAPAAPVRLAPAAAPARKALAGIGLTLLGLFLFGANNAVMKSLIARYPVAEMVALRSLISLLLLAPFLRAADLRQAVRLPGKALHLLRMTMSGMEIICFFSAAAVLPLADVSTIYLATPIYVTALSALLLRERVGWRSWAAVLVGFGGVLIALQPTRAAISPAAGIALAGGLMFSLVVVTTRKLRGAPNQVLIAFQLCAALAVSLAILGRGWVVPRWVDLAILLGGSTMSVAGYAAFNQSLRVAPASVVTPFQYSSLIWAAMFGFVLFGEVPGTATLLGAAVIVGAGLFILLRTRAGR